MKKLFLRRKIFIKIQTTRTYSQNNFIDFVSSEYAYLTKKSYSIPISSYPQLKTLKTVCPGPYMLNLKHSIPLFGSILTFYI